MQYEHVLRPMMSSESVRVERHYSAPPSHRTVRCPHSPRALVRVGPQQYMSSPGPTAFLRPPASPPGRLVLERRGTDYSVSTSDDDTPTPYHVTPILEPIRLLGESAAPNPVHATPAPDLSSRPESGWAAVARSIRDVDEQKIKDVKEDIDNILVFAGLYSAVLSALIAISILSLQPDSSGTIIVLLTQLVAQTHSYTITPGSLNSTTPPIDATAIANAPFEPLLAAKRVNVLWFASLTLSLLSASFSILVKQWLREYLAGEYVSPQARLRIRYFRKPGLKQWHVFGIASLLPVVLQLALALFFVGLCFFTLDIHTSIGYTTIPLVAGWALLLVATAFAPSVSPQCSYKIPLLRPITQALRSFMFKSLKFLKELSNLPAESSHVAHPMDAWLALDCTEEVVAQDKRFDIEILSEIDRTQGDDQLLLKMCRAVRETLSPEKSFEFVVKILAARLPSVNFSAGRFPMMLDFTKLPSRTCTILLDANADALYQELSQFPPSQVIQWSCWSWNSLMLLFAQLPCTLSERAMATISLCFTATSHTRVNNIFTAMLKDCAGTSDEQDELILYLLKRLRPTFNRTRISHVLASLLRLFAIRFCPENGRRCRSLPECFATHDIPDGLVRQICDLLTSRMLDDVNGDVAWSGRHDDIIQFLCKYRYKIKEDEREWDHNIELRILASAILQRQEIMPRFGRFLYDPMRLDPNCMHIYHTTFAYSTMISS
ncbi:hypothetical protein BDW22DRAFT_823003 [Trametopsis cervina]|nr:hypothetical protein BDW22DRAFT_823003 [Trametopsis cervina]